MSWISFLFVFKPEKEEKLLFNFWSITLHVQVVQNVTQEISVNNVSFFNSFDEIKYLFV